jgi:hypothetical protein
LKLTFTGSPLRNPVPDTVTACPGLGLDGLNEMVAMARLRVTRLLAFVSPAFACRTKDPFGSTKLKIPGSVALPALSAVTAAPSDAPAMLNATLAPGGKFVAVAAKPEPNVSEVGFIPTLGVGFAGLVAPSAAVTVSVFDTAQKLCSPTAVTT